MALYGFTVFLGAFLLFQVQPLLGRYILPWFGGGPSVWTTCLLFFQTLLLGGYAFAHFIATRVRAAWQGRVYVAALVLAAATLPIAPNEERWKQAVSDAPEVRILLLLMAAAGLPYLLLSAASPLVQRWFHQAHPKRESYRLYALSNAGSLLALVSYPAVAEPLLGVRLQAWLWSGAFLAFAVAAAACALARKDAPPEPAAPPAPPTPLGQALLWLLLSACGSALLVASTDQMTQEVAVFPFLWVLPLTLYLATFVFAFESGRWYRPRLYGFLLAAAIPGGCAAFAAGGLLPLTVQVGLFSTALFVACMVCHGELAASRPCPTRATQFYFVVAAGGALGGVFVAVIAPRLFPGYWEYPIALAAAAILYLWRNRTQRRTGRSPQEAASWSFQPPPALALALLTVGYAFAAGAQPGTLATDRSFYGVLRVTEKQDAQGRDYRALEHGRTQHGFQYLSAELAGRPTSYFGPGTGAAEAFKALRRSKPSQPLSIGIVGLGAGTLAAYGRHGDTIRFYEINPQVVAAACEWFSYLADSPAETEVVLGDARVRLEEELEDSPEPFDLLAIDAFSSGAIPAHLLTVQAGGVYARRLAPDGLLLFHITNRYLDLAPVVRGIAQSLGMAAVEVANPPRPDLGVSESRWMILSADPAALPAPAQGGRTIVWTDDYAALWSVLR